VKKLSARPTVVDIIRHLFTNGCQFEKLLFDEGVFGGLGKFPVLGRLFSEIIGVVRARRQLELVELVIGNGG
jgi:hypothetical protein